MSSLSCARRAAVPTRGRPAPAHPSGSTNGRSFQPIPASHFAILGILPRLQRVSSASMSRMASRTAQGSGSARRSQSRSHSRHASSRPCCTGYADQQDRNPSRCGCPSRRGPPRKGARRGERPLRPLGAPDAQPGVLPDAQPGTGPDAGADTKPSAPPPAPRKEAVRRAGASPPQRLPPVGVLPMDIPPASARPQGPHPAGFRPAKRFRRKRRPRPEPRARQTGKPQPPHPGFAQPARVPLPPFRRCSCSCS